MKRVLEVDGFLPAGTHADAAEFPDGPIDAACNGPMESVQEVDDMLPAGAPAEVAKFPDGPVDAVCGAPMEGVEEVGVPTPLEASQPPEAADMGVDAVPDEVLMSILMEELPEATAAGEPKSSVSENRVVCSELLATILETGDVAAIMALREFLVKDRHAMIMCRHHGLFQVVVDAWRAQPGDTLMAASSSALLLVYSTVHSEVLRRLGTGILCTEALSLGDASKLMAPVARLWQRLGAALPASSNLCDLLTSDCSDPLTLRPLLRGMASKTAAGTEQLDNGTQIALQSLLEGALAKEAMRVLCNCLAPIRFSSCPRSTHVGDGGDDSDSDGGSAGGAPGSDAEGEESTAGSHARKLKRGSRPAPPAGASVLPEERYMSLDAYLGLVSGVGSSVAASGDEFAPHAMVDSGGDAARPAEEAVEKEAGTKQPPNFSPVEEEQEECDGPPGNVDGDCESSLCSECRAHLQVDAESSDSWQVAYPGEGAAGFSFAADFDSGNLRSARVDPSGALEIALFGDTSSSRHCQWFHFEVQVQTAVRVKFRVVTFQKPKSTLSEGQRIFTKSSGNAGWKRSGYAYAYHPNRYMVGSRGGLFTLSFMLDLPAGATRLAFFAPYTFADLVVDLRRLRLASSGFDEERLRVQELGPTLGGRPLPLLSISDFSATSAGEPRPRVLVMARTHPGEVPSSFVLRGVLEELLSDAPEAQDLRKRLIFHVIPMMNPDGVAAGNTRCNGSGLDLNRQWESQPEGSEAALAKAALERVGAAPGGVLAVLDLHAHSRLHGAFTFGNPQSQALPDLLASLEPEVFARDQCTFRYTKDKRGSARCVAWREFGVLHAHTLEVSFASVSEKQRPLTLADLSGLGRSLIRATGRLPMDCGAEAGQGGGTEVRSRHSGGRATRRRCSARQNQGPSFELVM